MVRLLNRAAYRYLVRDGQAPPTVAAPGPDLRATTDWAITNDESTDSIMLSDPAHPHLYLQIKEGALFFGEQVSGPSNSAVWLLIPVGDGSGYFHLVDAYFPGHGLMLGERVDRADISFQARIGPVDNSHETMWFVDQETNACVRDARSIHLRYPSTSPNDLFYNEVSPLDAPLGTYFCATGFGEDNRGPGPCGYAGLQRRADGSRIAIFSVWHRMPDEVTPDPDALAVITQTSPNAERTSFDGEGSGQSIRIPFAWEDDTESSIRFAIIAKRDESDTVLTAYVAKSESAWVYIGAIRRVNTAGHLLTGLYAFIEDFMRNGNEEGVPADQRSPYQARRAVFSNPWVDGVAGRLEPITSAKVTAYGPHPLENLSVLQRGTPSDEFDLLVSTGRRSSTSQNVIGTTIKDSSTGARRKPALTEDMYAL
jgi:hypothetical protein